MNSPNIRPRGKTRIGRLSSGARLVASLITVLVLAALSFAAGNQFFGSGLTGQINFIASYLGIQNAPTVPVSTTQTVTPANSNGWTASADTCNVPGVTATSSFVSGPATAPLGDGSFRMQVGSNGDSYAITRNPNYSGVRLDQLTTLGYSTFVTAYGSGGQAPYMSLNLDLDGDNVVDDQIFFEPIYQDATFFPANPQPSVALGTWQTWDALHGGWWSNNTIAGAGQGTGVKSIAQYLAAEPNARIMNSEAGGGLRVLAGCGGGAWANFDGNFDNLRIAYSGSDITFDFDPNPPTVVTVRPESLNGWTSAEPIATTTAGGAVNFISDSTAQSGFGALQMTTVGTSASKAQLMRVEPIPLANITDLSYFTKQNSAPFSGAAASFQVGVLLDGVGNFTTFSFEPYENGTVTSGTWQEWNVAAGQFWSSRTRAAGGACNVSAGAGGAPFYTLADLKANCPNAVVVQYGVNIGTSNPNYDIEADLLRVNGTVYDFEPSQFKVVDVDGQASATSCDDSDAASTTIAAAVSAANPGDTIKVCPGTYPTASTIAVNKAGLTIIGATATRPVIQTSGTNYLFLITGAGVTLDNLELQKTDLASVQNIIGVQADNFTAQNNLIYGPDPGGTWDTVGLTSRAFEVSTHSGLLIQNNVIHTLRQPAYINPGTTGSVLNNNVSGTKGWVNDGGNITFNGNTWGEPQNQSCDIALTPQVNPANYPSLLALSTANDNAFVCAQYTGGENGRALAFVDSTPSFGNGSDNQNYTTIQEGVNGALTGGTVQVAAGTYGEDVLVNKTLKVVGAGQSSSVVIGPIGGAGSTFTLAANNIELSGFTITRAGNNPTDWNNPGLNTAGIAIQGTATTGAQIHDNLITGLRTGIDINNSGGHTVRNNVITDNRTGLIFRNQTDNMTVVENEITNNWTVGVLFLDASGGTNSPIQSALNCTFSNNKISGNWYGQIVDRQLGGSLPAPGTTNLKNFSNNWFGTNTPVVSTADSGEPGYAAQIPVAYGGTAVAPGGQPDILGPASANFDYSPYLSGGADTNVQTTPGRGTYGFQGSFNALTVTAASAQSSPGLSNIQEGINSISAGGDLTVLPGTYAGNVDINKAIDLKGTPTITGTLSTSVAGASISPGNSPGVINSGSLSLISGSTVNIDINGPILGTQYDQLNVTGSVSLGNATLVLNPGFTPAIGNQFVIVNNDGADPVIGEFNGMAEGATTFFGTVPMRITYQGGDGNDVVLSAVNLCNVVSIPTNISTPTGVSVTVPINVDDTTGNGVLSYDFTIAFDPSVINSPTVDKTGTLSSGMTVTTHTTSNTITVSGFQGVPLTGSGPLLKINFNAVGAVGTSSGVNFTSFTFNEGTCSSTVNGSVVVNGGSISGTVSYANPQTPGFVPVPNTTLSAVGSVNLSTTSAFITGDYTLTGFGSGAYTVTPSKTGDVNGISSFDAGLIAQHVVTVITLTPPQLAAADVSGNGTVTSFDAALIARYVALLPNSGNTGTWKFAPVNRSYPNVNTGFTGEDYSATLMGDVSGNWAAPTSFAPFAPAVKPPSPDALIVTASSAKVSAGSVVELPVTVRDTTGKGIISYQFDVNYDSDVVTPIEEPATVAQTLSDGMSVTTNIVAPGTLRVVVFGSTARRGEGVLINLKFAANGAEATSPIRMSGFMFNEGTPEASTVDGEIVVSAAPNPASVSGLVLSSSGQPIAGARITVTGDNGVSFAARTNTFGRFNVEGLSSGESYTVAVQAKGYTFAPRTVTLSQQASSVQIFANE